MHRKHTCWNSGNLDRHRSRANSSGYPVKGLIVNENRGRGETDLRVGATTGVGVIFICHFALADESMSRVWLEKDQESVTVKYRPCHTHES